MKKIFAILLLLVFSILLSNCGDTCESDKDCLNGHVCNDEKVCVPVQDGTPSEKGDIEKTPDASSQEETKDNKQEKDEQEEKELPPVEKAGCQQPICKPGTSECVGSYISYCRNEATGCGKWLTPVPCKSGFECNGKTCQKVCKTSSDCFQGESCNKGYCGACQNQCKLGDSKCNGNTAETCVNINGCLQWKKEPCQGQQTCKSGKCVHACQKHSDCGNNAICEKSKCVSCSTSCKEGDVQCNGKDIETCIVENGCKRWKTSKSCSANETCLRGLCVGTCTTHTDCTKGQECSNFTCVSCQNSCSSSKTVCDGQDLKVCKQTNSCWAWEKQSCGAGRGCNAGKCVETCTKNEDCSSGSHCKNKFCETCQNTCTKGAKKCDSKELYECQSVNGCLQWVKQSCGNKEICHAGKCEASCSKTSDCSGGKTCTQGVCLSCASCKQGDARCQTGVREVCQVQNGCPQWSQSPCGSGTICAAGSCVTSCKQDSDCNSSQLCVNQTCQSCSSQCSGGSKRCSSNQPQQCVQKNGCFVWENTQACGNKQVCSVGNCVYSCTQDSDCPTSWSCKNKLCESKNWMMQFGADGDEKTSFVHVDKQGNIYLIGIYSETMTIGSKKLQSANNREDFFVVKMDAQKNVQWVKSFGSAYEDKLDTSIMDAQGNLYITGQYDNSIAIGNTVLQTKKSNTTGTFIMKMDSFGNTLWVRGFSSGSTQYYASVETNSLALDQQGNLYIGGQFYWKLMEEKNSKETLFTDNKNAYYRAGFAAKLDTQGKTKWMVKLGDGYQRAHAIYAASSGDIFLSQSDNLFYRLDSTGKVVWKKTFKTLTEIRGAANGNLIVLGHDSFYLAEIDVDAKEIWKTKNTQGKHDIFYPKALHFDSKGDMFVVGFNKGTVSIGNLSMVSKGGVDASVLKFDSKGTVQWIKTIGGTSDDYGTGLSLDAHGHIFFSGYFASSEFYIGSNKYSKKGDNDIFLIKMKSDGTLP